MPAVIPGWSRERSAASRGRHAIAGIDEAGRGALAGPVVAAAVILNPGDCPQAVRDSKLLSPSARERLYGEIVASARAWAVGSADSDEIDRSNILVATRLAMMRAVAALRIRPDYLIIDAVALPELGIPLEAPTGADRDVMSVAAASILAKVTRDRLVREFDARYGDYGFASHKGYGTARHLRALSELGPSPVHRLSFRPVAFLRREPNLD